MYEYLEGSIAEQSPARLVVDVAGEAKEGSELGSVVREEHQVRITAADREEALKRPFMERLDQVRRSADS